MDRRLQALGAQLVIQQGRPEIVVPEVARRVRATEVHVSADFGPYGTKRDQRVAAALGSVPLVQTGSPYAVSPHRLTTVTGQPYKVFTPYFRAWSRHGWPAPASSDPNASTGSRYPVIDCPTSPLFHRAFCCLPLARTRQTRRGWRFTTECLSRYSDTRDRPDLDVTSRISAYLHLGVLHPRTLLSALGPEDERFVTGVGVARVLCIGSVVLATECTLKFRCPYERTSRRTGPGRRGAFRGLEGGPDRIPHCRCRNAPTAV